MKTFRCKLGLFPQCLAIWPLPVLWCPTSILVAHGQVFSTCLTYVQMIHGSMEVLSFDSIDSSTILSADPTQMGHVVFVIWASNDLEWYFVCIVCSLSVHLVVPISTSLPLQVRTQPILFNMWVLDGAVIKEKPSPSDAVRMSICFGS